MTKLKYSLKLYLKHLPTSKSVFFELIVHIGTVVFICISAVNYKRAMLRFQ